MQLEDMDQKPILPPRLSPGDRVGIAAPSGGFDREALLEGCAMIAEMGFEPVVPEGVYVREGYLAGPDDHRAEGIQALFADPEIKAIFCARGGYGALRILSMLDYPGIKKSPKAVIGFSDITAMLYTLYQSCGWVTFHGPLATTLPLENSDSLNVLKNALTAEEPLRYEIPDGIVIRGGRAQGPLLGGNLATLCHLVGTPFHPRFWGRILFLEDRGEPPYRIDRMLTQMRLAGCFDGVRGVLLGAFTEGAAPDEVNRLVAQCFGGMEIPILSGMASGHIHPNLTLPLGVPALLDADRAFLQYRIPATAPTEKSV